MAITTNFGAYVKGFSCYPIDTRTMTNGTNDALSTAIKAITSHDIFASVYDIQWTYFGSAGFVTVFYTTTAVPLAL